MMKRKKDYLIAAVCGVMIVMLLMINFGIGTFFHYYSIVSVKGDDDYSDVVVTQSDEYLSEVADVAIELPEEEVFSNEGVINILLIGTDERTVEFSKASRADSIMLMSLNTRTFDVRLVSFERDTYVAVPKVPKRNPDKLGHTFHWGGANLLMETLQTHFSLDVNKYVRVNFFVFQKLIDILGGVEIDLTKSEASILSHQTGLRYIEGKNHLDGTAALIYSRIRVIDSDWERVKRQQNVIVAVKNRFSHKNVTQLKAIIDECLPYVQTNLSAGECAYLLLNIQDYAKGDVLRKTIPEQKTFNTLKRVDFKTNAKILREFLYN